MVNQGSSPALEELQNQVSSLQQKVLDLEAKFMTIKPNFKYALSKPSQPLDSSKIDQHYNYTLNTNMGSSLQENDNKFNQQQATEPSESGPEDKISALTPLSKSQDYKLSSNQEKGLHEPNFITLKRISEQERIEIIQRGFQLQAEGKISLKKYYESTDSNSLFQLKGYNIKYESIRRTKLYQQ